MLERAGAQILTCHGRMREQRGQNTVCRSPSVSSDHWHLLFPLTGSRGLGKDTCREGGGIGTCFRERQYPHTRRHCALPRRDRCGRGHVRRGTAVQRRALCLFSLRRVAPAARRPRARVPRHRLGPEDAHASERDQGPPVQAAPACARAGGRPARCARPAPRTGPRALLRRRSGDEEADGQGC